MTEIADAHPEVDVPTAEYARLLGYPRGRTLHGRAAELADQARAWYRRHGRPWLYARASASLDGASPFVRIDGVPFTAERLRARLEQSGAHGVALVAVGAGAELEEDASRRWRDEKPDEYYFFDVLGSSIVEHLILVAGARLCAWAGTQGAVVLPHDSPGYPGWDVAEQPRLLELITRTRGTTFPAPIEALASGALRPRKAQLAVFGLTGHPDRVGTAIPDGPCLSCPFAPCAYRRAPARQDAAPAGPRAIARGGGLPDGWTP
jgi:hypothetical protein